MEKNVKKVAILLFGDYLRDGRVQRTAEALKEKFNVKVFVTSDYIGDYPKEFRGVAIEFSSLKSKKLLKHPLIQIIKFIEYFWVTSIQIKKFDPDIIHCNDVFTILFGWIFKFRGKKVVYDSHELWKDTQHKYAYNSRLFKMLYWLEKVIIGKIDAVITVGDYIADILQRDYMINRPFVIKNITETENVEQTDIVREKGIISKGDKIVLYIGGLSAGRGLEKVVQSCRFWNDEIVLVVLGFGVLKDKLLQMRSELRLQNKIYFLDSVSQNQVLKYANSCDAGIIPYENTCLNHYYALPNKIFQLAQMRIPILVSNFPEMKQLVDKYSLGYTFDPGEPREIANAVNELFETNFSINDKNYEKFSKDFNWKNEKCKLMNLYNKLF